ncbi:hypothetical protein [Oleiharenicola sp. Vm1]|uniref:hypothetical protein n=1 Tax=Oleiharenicola sp. Vm1 TaxID=3398393 RepID=UPI0039F44BEC
MGLFSSNKSTTQNTTNYNITDQSANAAEGAIAAGAGATVEINTTTADPEIAKGAFDTALGAVAANQNTALGALAANQNTSLGALAANQNVSQRAIDTTAGVANLSIAAQNDLAKTTVAQNSALSLGAINTVAGLAEVSARERQDVLNTTTTALNSQQGLASKIADLTSAALERSQTPDSAVTKQLLWVVGAVAVLGMLFLFGASRRKSA